MALPSPTPGSHSGYWTLGASLVGAVGVVAAALVAQRCPAGPRELASPPPDSTGAASEADAAAVPLEVERRLEGILHSAALATEDAIGRNDPRPLHPVFTGERLLYLEQRILALAADGYVEPGIYHADKSYSVAVRQREQRVYEVDRCEYWEYERHDLRSRQLIERSPPQVYPQTVTIRDWKIAAVESYPPPYFCES